MEELNGVTGIKSDYAYYPSGNVKSLRHFSGKNIVSGYEYKYDLRGNQTEKNKGAGTTKYYYDALSRIKTAVEPNKTQSYEYDDLDNIKQLAEIQGSKIEETNYTYDRNSRLLLQEQVSGNESEQNRFTYDAAGYQTAKEEVVKRNGNLVSNKSSKFDYNGFNQLQRVQDDNGEFTEYTYNGNGLRTKKQTVATTVYGFNSSGVDKTKNYIYDNGGNIILETNNENRIMAKNIRGLGLIYRESYANSISDPQMLYYLHNANGDVTQLLNEKAEVVKDYRYDTFGQGELNEFKAFGGKQSVELWRQEVEKIDNPFRYGGEYQDSETGNYYLRARYYDPSMQRFINEDSYGVEKGAGWLEPLYNYCKNNPMRYVDPSGHRVGNLLPKTGGGYTVIKPAAKPVAKPAAKSVKKPVAKTTTSTAAKSVNNAPAVTTSASNTASGSVIGSGGGGKNSSKGTIKDEKPTTTTTNTPKATSTPTPAKGVKSIQEIADENHLDWVPSAISKGATSQGLKPYKQTAGAIFLGLAVKSAAWQAATAPTPANAKIEGANIASDILGPIIPPPTTPSGFFYYVSNELLDVEGIVRDAFKPKKK